MALLHVAFHSHSLMMNVDMDVILPEETIRQIGMQGHAGESYPTLYLLHGMSDDHTIWQRRTSIERYVADKNLAVVMPAADLSWYTDMARGYPYWTFISEELPAVCRAMFPRMSARREDNFVAGLSMGGYGALKLGLRKSEAFSYVAALSSSPDAAKRSYTGSENMRSYWADVFGPLDQIEGSFNDLFAAARELDASGKEKPHIYMWCGTEDKLFPDNEKMRDCLKENHFDLVWEQSAGTHAWKYWDDKIQTVLQWLPLKGGK